MPEPSELATPALAPGIERRRLEAADRNALGTEGNHADDLRIVEPDLDGLSARSSARPPAASGSLVVRGLATLGNCILQRTAQQIGLLDFLVFQRDPRPGCHERPAWIWSI